MVLRRTKKQANGEKQGLPSPPCESMARPREKCPSWEMLSSSMFQEQRQGWDPWAGEEAGEACSRSPPPPCVYETKVPFQSGKRLTCWLL